MGEKKIENVKVGVRPPKPTPTTKEGMDGSPPPLSKRDSKGVDHRLRKELLAMASKQNKLGMAKVTEVSIALKLLHAGADGEINEKEIDAILGGLRSLYDMILLFCTLLFSGLFGFIINGVADADPWLPDNAVNMLEWMFVVCVSLTTVLFLSPMCVCTLLYFYSLQLVTVPDKVWFLKTMPIFKFLPVMGFGFLGLMTTGIVGAVLAHGVKGIVAASLMTFVFWATSFKNMLQVTFGLAHRLISDTKPDVLASLKSTSQLEANTNVKSPPPPKTQLDITHTPPSA